MSSDSRPDRVSLVIPTLNGGERFVRVLDMWRAQQDVGRLDICCPDSGSQDGTLDAIRQAGGRMLAIAPSLFNHGETRNRAVATTHTDYVILSVQDALPLSTTVARDLIEPLEKDPAVLATFGRQVPRPDCHPALADRIGAWAGGDEPEMQELGERTWDELSPLERLRRIRYDHVIACMRRSVWEQHRFEHVPFGEDICWSARVIRHGGRIVFVPKAAVEHSHARSAWDEARRIYCDHANLHRLVGLVTVPSRRVIGQNVAAARQRYAELIEAKNDVDATTRAVWKEWADKLACYENWAQYLGAHFSHRWWFQPVDRWLKRGI